MVFLLRQLPTIPEQKEAQGNRMKKHYFLLPITGILLFMLLIGCAKTRIGKVELSDEKLPDFIKVGTTRAQEVLEQIGIFRLPQTKESFLNDLPRFSGRLCQFIDHRYSAGFGFSR